jgi:hypothetical protein
VVFYYGIGKTARWSSITPEFVMAYAGAALAFALTLLLFFTVRHFLPHRYATWWVFLALLLGGGLGGHLRWIGGIDLIRREPLLRLTLVDSIAANPVFEDHRGHYVISALFDTHFALLWLVCTTAVLSLYAALRRFSAWRAGLAALLFAAMTLIHVYESVTLLAIAAAVAALCWRKGVAARPALLTAAACTAATLAVLVWLHLLQRGSGLPMPAWRGSPVLLATLLMAYPLAWGLMAWGLRDYWRTAGVPECFLLGWALGCLAVTMSAPFYPYPARGALTLQIPLFLIAGTIYFGRAARVSAAGTVLALALLAPTPLLMLRGQWREGTFRTNAPYAFLGPEHRATIDALRERAAPGDLLLVDKSGSVLEHDDLWLAPEFPGRHYSAHFFLTVDYARKRDRAARFFQGTPGEQETFLRREHVDFLYVPAWRDPKRFAAIPGLTVVKETSLGTLYEFTDGRG